MAGGLANPAPWKTASMTTVFSESSSPRVCASSGPAEGPSSLFARADSRSGRLRRPRGRPSNSSSLISGSIVVVDSPERASKTGKVSVRRSIGGRRRSRNSVRRSSCARLICPRHAQGTPRLPRMACPWPRPARSPNSCGIVQMPPDLLAARMARRVRTHLPEHEAGTIRRLPCRSGLLMPDRRPRVADIEMADLVAGMQPSFGRTCRSRGGSQRPAFPSASSSALRL